MKSDLSDLDIKNLNLAVEQAKIAHEKGNYPVGAILTIDEIVIGSGANKINQEKSHFDHAEMNVIAANASKLFEAYNSNKQITLYSTLEPCIQ